MATGSSLTQNHSRSQSEIQGYLHKLPGLTHVLYHEIDTGDQGPVVSKPYRYDKVKHGKIDNHIEKMLQEDAIRPIQSLYWSPVFLTFQLDRTDFSALLERLRKWTARIFLPSSKVFKSGLAALF